ncbi:MAG: hypothetical protein KAG28_07145 [Cocleimonas sp.]|nr:hypothetical protein [Cocleimonas sp.]
MSKLLSTLLILFSVTLLSACGESRIASTGTDHPTNVVEYENKTLEQAKALEAEMKHSFNEKLGSL